MITAGPIEIEPATREAKVHGALLLVTMGEFDLLTVLTREPEREWRDYELLELVPRAWDLGAEWLKARAWHLSAQLLRVGVRNDLARSDGSYRLFKPEEDECAA